MRRTSSVRAKAIDAPDELDVGGAPWRIRAHELLIFAHGELRLLVVPGKRQMHDAAFHGDASADRAGSCSSANERVQQARRRKRAAVVVHLQRADAGREIDEPGKPFRLERLHQEMRAQAQAQDRAPSGRIRRECCRRPRGDRRRASGARRDAAGCRPRARAAKGWPVRRDCSAAACSGVIARKRSLSPGSKLAELPQLARAQRRPGRRSRRGSVHRGRG